MCLLSLTYADLYTVILRSLSVMVKDVITNEVSQCFEASGQLGKCHKIQFGSVVKTNNKIKFWNLWWMWFEIYWTFQTQCVPLQLKISTKLQWQKMHVTIAWWKMWLSASNPMGLSCLFQWNPGDFWSIKFSFGIQTGSCWILDSYRFICLSCEGIKKLAFHF